MTEYTVQVKSTHAILAAFRISNDLMEHQYLKEKYGVDVSRYDIGKFLIVDKETNRYLIQNADSFNANYEVANRESIYPMIPFKNAEDRPKLNVFSNGSVYDWLRKEFSGVACAPTFKHIDIREQKKEKNTMYGKSKTINFCVNKVIFNGPATIVIWGDGTKTVVKCKDGDSYSKWAGFAMCIAKRLYGEDFHFIFRHWCGVEDDIPKKNTGDALSDNCASTSEPASRDRFDRVEKEPDFQLRKVYYGSHAKAWNVREALTSIIATNGYATVADYYDISDVEVSPEEHKKAFKYGWKNIGVANIGLCGPSMFKLDIPEPKKLNLNKPNEAKGLD